MKGSVLILIGVVGVLLIGGAFALTFVNEIADVADGGNSGTFHKIADKVEQATSSGSQSTNSGSNGDGDSNIISEIVKFNGQNDGGYYREVTYKDGGFRQFDNATGELIGSSYDEDQEKLGVVNGNLE